VLLSQWRQLSRRDCRAPADDRDCPNARLACRLDLGSIVEGFRYIQRTKPVRALLLLVGLISLLGVPYAVLMPIFADQILHGGSRGYGILMGASGFGALIGALVLAAKKTVQGLGRWMAFAATGFGQA